MTSSASEKKTVCMISDKHDAYDDRIYWKEAFSLTKLGYRVVHICVGKKTDIHMSAEGISIVQIKKNLLFSNRYLNYCFEFVPLLNLHFRLFKAAKKQKADFYHLHDLQLLRIIKKLKRLPWKPKVFHCVRESYGDMIRDYSGSQWYSRLLRNLYAKYIEGWEVRMIRYADAIITIDDAAYDKFGKLFGKKVNLVYNYTNIFPEKVTSSQKSYDLIYTGGITTQRGILAVLEAISMLKAKLPDITLLILGRIYKPKFKALLNQRITDLNIQQNVIYKEFVPHPEVKDYLAKSRIGLVTLLPIPKFQKNIPIKQFEYMAFGLPVIGSKLPPIENFIGPVDAGILVDPTKPKEIADAIEKLLTDQQFYARQSENATNAAREKYNWISEEKKLAAIYSNPL